MEKIDLKSILGKRAQMPEVIVTIGKKQDEVIDWINEHEKREKKG